jgi:hypothetical protein
MTIRRASFPILFMCLLVAGALPYAQNQRPRLPGEDWVQLFNGTDLTGWTKIGQEQWTVRDGVIHGVAVTKAYGYLMTEKSYKDFHLSLKFLCQGDGNSGVFFHTAFKPGTPSHRGCSSRWTAPLTVTRGAFTAMAAAGWSGRHPKTRP